MRFLLAISWFSISYAGFGQYPFEQFPTPKYREYKNWIEYDLMKSKGRLHYTISVPEFFNNKDSLTIQLSQYNTEKFNYSSVIRIFKGKQQLQKFDEPMFVFYANSGKIFVSDFNNDGLPDVKLCVPYGGNGLASINYRVIYFVQNAANLFGKLSFLDKMFSYRQEHDLDGDGMYEIVTMELNHINGHNYWTFNAYNFQGDSLVCVNEKLGYPIMFQYLFKPNYKQASLPDSLVKKFARKLPEDYYKNQ